MKQTTTRQRGTQQNGTKRPTSRARTTDTVPDTVHGIRSTVKKRSTKTGPNQEETRTTVGAVPVAEAAQMFGVDPKTVKRMCASGKLDCFKTPGGHWRVHLAGIEAMRRGDTDTKNGRSSGSSPSLQYRKESLEELRLLIEEKKVRAALQELEGHERQKREQEEAARQAEENEARREQRERESELARRNREHEERARQDLEEERQREAEKQWEQWANSWLEYGLTYGLESLAPNLPRELVLQVQPAIEEVLKTVSPTRPAAMVQQLVLAAIQRVIAPWQRQQEIEQAIRQATKELPVQVRNFSDFSPRTEWETRAMAAAREAIAHLALDVSLAEVRAAAVGAGRRVAQEYQLRGEQERAQHKREEQADTYLLLNLLPYLWELQAAPDGIDFEGKIFEDEQRIKNAIRPKLVAEVAGLDYVSGPRRVRELAREWLETSLTERPK